MGTDRTAAIRAAKKLNGYRGAAGSAADRLIQRVEADPDTMTVRSFAYDEFLPAYRTGTTKRGRPKAKGTIYDAESRINKVVEQWGERPVAEITTRDLVKLLKPLPDRTSNAYRTLLNQFFSRAIQEGHRDDHPVTQTTKRTDVVKRQRLSKDEFDAIREHAEPWLQNAMNLSLYSLQSLAEIVAMKFADEREPGYLFIDRKKVEKDECGHIRIEIGPTLREVLQRCRDDLASPFVIHRRPKRQTVAQRNALEHWSQVTGDFLSGEFKKARDKAGVGKHLEEGKTPPSFHEIRSLGGRLLREQGCPKEYVQLLLGHTTLRMTDVYLDSRGGQVQYVDAKSP